MAALLEQVSRLPRRALLKLQWPRMSQDILNQPSPSADFRIAYGSDPNQFFDLRVPKSKAKTKAPYPLVINIHGGYWRARYDLNHAGHLCTALTAQGLATANVEYRRVGNQGGGWRGTFADIRAAYNFLLQNLEQYEIDARRALILGHSAGGQLALCLAAHEPRVRAVISLAGVVDLQRAYDLHLSHDAVVEFLGGSPSEVAGRYREADPMQLSISGVRQVLFHSSMDAEVPPDFSRTYVKTKGKRTGREKENLRLVEIPGAGHYDLIDPRTTAWRQVEETVLQLLE